MDAYRGRNYRPGALSLSPALPAERTTRQGDTLPGHLHVPDQIGIPINILLFAAACLGARELLRQMLLKSVPLHRDDAIP